MGTEEPALTAGCEPDQTKGEDKETDPQGACLGLLAYPVLQAADILLFKWESP